jgi:hypothetical protein
MICRQPLPYRIMEGLPVIRQLNGHLRYGDYHQLRTSTSARRVLVLSDNVIRLYSLCRMAKL